MGAVPPLPLAVSQAPAIPAVCRAPATRPSPPSASAPERGRLARTRGPVAARGASCVGARTGRGPIARWSQDRAWSLAQGKGWDHRASFTRKTWDHGRGPSTTRGPGTTAAMGPRKRHRGPMVGPRKRRCGSARHGRWDHDGTPCRTTMRAVPSSPEGLAAAVQTGPHAAQDGDDSPHSLRRRRVIVRP